MRLDFKILAVLLAFLLNYQSENKTKYSVVTYQMGKPISLNPKNTAKNEEAEKLFNEMDKAYSDVACELFFNETKSIFKIIDKIELKDDFAYKMASLLVEGVYYKDIKNKKKIKQVDCYGQTLNVNLPFEEFKWEITSETKNISGYKCFKAKTVWVEYDKTRNKTNTFYPEVWFTPEIPTSFGPQGLDGLPGLVLEGKFNNICNFYAVKIKLNVEDSKIDFDKELSGKFVNVEEYQDIMMKAYKNIIENDK